MLGIALTAICVGRWMQNFEEVPTTTKKPAAEAVTKGAGYKSSAPSRAEAVEPGLWEQL